MRHCNQCMWCSSVQAARREQHTNRKMYDWNNITVPFQRANCINIIITTHSVSHCRCNADQNRKTGQMGCYAANMSGVDDISLHPSVGPPSSLVALFSCKVKESTAKLLHLPWWYWETLWFHLQEKGSRSNGISMHKCNLRIVYAVYMYLWKKLGQNGCNHNQFPFILTAWDWYTYESAVYPTTYVHYSCRHEM